jgi:hypothetical protein
MRRDTALVDGVRRISKGRKRTKSADSTIEVVFAGGAVGELDPAIPRDRIWVEVLESLRASRRPAYVEFDASRRITSLLLPRAYTVVEIREASRGSGLQIELDISHALHYLPQDNPRFDELRRVLQDANATGASVLVTETPDGAAIVDVRPVEDRS